jgi:regulatory protein
VIAEARLARAPATEAELARLLRSKGAPDDVVELLIERYRDVGLLDDRAFAQEWVQSRSGTRGLAPRRLAAELRRRGVDEVTLADAVEAVADPDDLRDSASALAVARAATMRGLPRATAARRLSGYLGRRGYDAETVAGAVRAALVDWPSDPGLTEVDD